MDNRKAKMLGLLVLVAAFVAFAFNSIRVTQFSILDNDPVTYIIVVMLMLPLAILFAMREKLELETKPANIAAGAFVLALYFVLVSVLRGSLSFIFQAYRIDAFLFPVVLVSLIVVLFGVKGLRSMRFVIIYSVFASPLLFLPVMALNSSFTSINAYFVYYLLKAVGVPVVKQGLVISAGGASHISIATTCADIGAFIAILMFLLPVAYLYYGRMRDKALWLLSGLGFMLLLNVLRMFAISLQWAYYGINTATATLHTFAGQVLFDIAIVVMVLIAGKFGLRVPSLRQSPTKARAKQKRRSIGMSPSAYAAPVAATIVIGVLGFLITLPYSSALYANPINFTANSLPSNSTVQATITASLENAHTDILYAGTLYGNMVFSLQNVTANSTQSNRSRVFVLAGVATRPLNAVLMGNVSGLSSKHVVILRNGIAVTSASSQSNGTTIYVSYFSAPAVIAGNETTTYYEFLARNGTAVCTADNGIANGAQSAVASILRGGTANETMLCSAYAVASGIG